MLCITVLICDSANARFAPPVGALVGAPEDAAAARAYAAEHPDRQEVRIVAGATRTGSTYCALRMRAHDEDTSVVGGLDLVPGLLELLRATLSDEPDTEAHLHHHEEDETP